MLRRVENRPVPRACPRQHPRVAPALLWAAAWALTGACGGNRPELRPDRPEPRSRPERPGPIPPEPPPGLLAALPEATRSLLVEAAARWLGRRGPFVAGGRRFHADCSGYVEAVYESVGLPVRDAIALRPEDEGSAAAALHRAIRELGVLYGGERQPLPGDLVFFHDTYDRNGNGEADDGVTHTGLVEEVRPDGTVVFLHRGGRVVMRGQLDLAAPDVARGPGGEPRNSALRVARRGDPAGQPLLAGQLFAGFGRVDPGRVAAVLEGNERLDLAALGYAEGRPLEELPIPPETRP
jgi:probable lipoprotein NlpC